MRSRRALTLIEMLVAMAVTLIMMGSVVTIFGLVGDSVSASRASIEISERLRNARNRLQEDLGSVTVTMLPPRSPANDEGYFEYAEGLASDINPVAPLAYVGAVNPSSMAVIPAWVQLLGDTDDIIAFTVRSRGEPFVGIHNGTLVQSQTAEVIWFTKQADDAGVVIDAAALDPSTGKPPRTRTLYRRIRLVAPQMASAPAGHTDISMRLEGTNWIGNTLGDLTKRENRFAHPPSTTALAAPNGFPFDLNPAALLPFDAASGHLGEDVILTNVLSFDVKAWDPNAPVRFDSTSSVALVPSDVYFNLRPATSDNVSRGAYVDLYYNRYLGNGGRFTSSNRTLPYFSYLAAINFTLTPPNSYFANGPTDSTVSPTLYASGYFAKSRLTVPTYDTWSTHYEQNGVSEDSGLIVSTVPNTQSLFNDIGIDTGTNGINDVRAAPNVNSTVDDISEMDTSPPYPVALRGVQIKLRVYEPDSRQVREVTVVQDFMPQ